jgi:two-component system, OmpR family, response regulator
MRSAANGTTMRLLLVEDDVKLSRTLTRGLNREGYAVDEAYTGNDALAALAKREYDAVVLDVLLPGIDGYGVCEALRERDPWLPVLMLTALGDVRDRIRGLDTGADDYLVKPFSLDELLARLRAIARRGATPRPSVLEVGMVRLDPSSRRAWHGSTELALTAREFSLLETFMRRPGEVLSRFELLEHVWDDSYENRSNVIDVYIGYLRDKLGRETIETVRGAGYRLHAKARVGAGRPEVRGARRG